MQVQSVLEISETSKIRILLNHHRWDEQRLLESFYDLGEDAILKKVGINVRAPLSTNNSGNVMPMDTNSAHDAHDDMEKYLVQKSAAVRVLF